MAAGGAVPAAGGSLAEPGEPWGARDCSDLDVGQNVAWRKLTAKAGFERPGIDWPKSFGGGRAMSWNFSQLLASLRRLFVFSDRSIPRLSETITCLETARAMRDDFIAMNALVGGIFFAVPASKNIDLGIRLILKNALEGGAAIGEGEIIGSSGQNSLAIEPHRN